MDSAGPLILPITQSIIYLLDFFQNKRADTDVLSRVSPSKMGEGVSGPLVRAHANLVKAHTESEVYLYLIAKSVGDYQKIFVRNHSEFFFGRIRGYITTYVESTKSINSRVPEVNEAVKGYADQTGNLYYDEVKKEMSHYSQVVETGGQLNPIDVTNYIHALQMFTSHYIEGIGETIEDLAHVGRALPDGSQNPLNSATTSRSKWNPFKWKI